LAALTMGVTAGASSATTPGANGVIAYQQEVHGVYQLFTIRPDGTSRHQLTHLSGGATHPAWSRDGKLIAYTKEKPPADGGVAVMSSTGGGSRNVTPEAPGVWSGAPVFTPDGKSLVFVRDRAPTDSGIWVVRSDGSGARRLTKNPFFRNGVGGDIAPTVSPDGKLVAFVRVKHAEKGEFALFTVAIDGTHLRQLTPFSVDVASKVDWSPDGKAILLSTNGHLSRPKDSANLATIQPDSGRLTQLTHFSGRKQNAYAGSFSPDGTQIVLRLEQGVSCRPTDAIVSGCTSAIAVVDRTGQHLRALMKLGSAKPRYVAWGPRP
jgi:Tol biopolymer transport system component